MTQFLVSFALACVMLNAPGLASDDRYTVSGMVIDTDPARLTFTASIDAIPNFIRQNKVDLVVMGTVARSGLSGMIIGNTAEQILSRIECSVLALKPAGFVCPVRLER